MWDTLHRGKGRRLTKLLSKDGAWERLDRFELIAELASGGMATVYLARLSGMAGFQRLYAIKRLHPHLAKEPEFVEMFLEEARLAARIHHPHVVPILEIGQSGGAYYLVMEYVEGDTAARLFARCAQAERKMPLPVGVRIVLDTLAGLHAAHELRDDNGALLQLVHRDVSPQNVLIGIDGSSHLTDFGVARATSRLSTTRTGHLKGKLSYMAPEQARGGPIDRRADIFAAGVMLWEMLTFQRLFKADADAETLSRVLYAPIPPVREFEPSVPHMLELVTMRALERDPSRRFATSAEFAEALEAAARAERALGTDRDVAQLVESLAGAELAANRDAVRQWLVREPSQSEPMTRTAPLARAAGSSPPTSSVSSAIINVPPPPPTAPHAGAPYDAASAPPPRGVVWTASAAASIVAAVAVVVAFATLRFTRPVVSTASAAPTMPTALATTAPADLARAPEPAAAPVEPAPPPTAQSPAPPDTGVATPAPPPPAASAARARATHPAPPAPPRPRAAPARPAPPAAAPASPPPAPAVPDDLSHNPYR